MRRLAAILSLLLFFTSSALAKVVVFWQDGFPTVASQPLARETLVKALDGMDPIFAGADALQEPATLNGADLLILPYGSAVLTDAWASIHGHLQAGGNLLILGGQPLRVPVIAANGKFIQARPQHTYSRELDFRHSYEVPRTAAKFEWRSGYSFLDTAQIRASRFFAVEGRLNGLGYMVNSDGGKVAAPVIVADHTNFATPGNARLPRRATPNIRVLVQNPRPPLESR
jgi:hypothetical protein